MRVEQGNLQGWHADPFGRHERRYFSAGRPTKLVRDGEDESYDLLPAEPSAATAQFADRADSVGEASAT